MMFLAPVAALGGVIGATAMAKRSGWVSAGVWDFLWPSLVAAGFLLLAAAILMTGLRRRWLWPAGTGFFVQIAVILMFWAGVGIDRPIDGLWLTLLLSFAALLVVVFHLVVGLILGRGLIDGVLRGTDTADVDDLTEIRSQMAEAIQVLRRKLGRNALYELPWVMVIGAKGAGKTEAIRRSDLRLPVKDDWQKGVGGTFTANWFFTDDLIFLDTPGEWVEQASKAGDKRRWSELLRLLKRHRRRMPLDGLIVVVEATDFLSKSEEELLERASNIRGVIDMLHDELHFRFPVYLLVSKCDLIQGFREFFQDSTPHQRHEIIGSSHPRPESGRPRSFISQSFQTMVRRLQRYRLERLAAVGSASDARNLYLFPGELGRLKEPLTLVAEELFRKDKFHQTPVFRGFYFTSAMWVGSPMSELLREIAAKLGIPVTTRSPAEAAQKNRSYFLFDLFRDVMAQDRGLVGRTARHWWRRRRDNAFVTFLPAVAAGAFLVFSAISLILNARLYHEIELAVPGIVGDLSTLSSASAVENAPQALELTEKLRRYHVNLTRFAPWRGFGMRRCDALSSRVLALFRREFVTSVVDPTFGAAAARAADPNQTCPNRLEAFYGVLWLRQGHRWEGSDELAGLARTWKLDADQLVTAREGLSRQFAYLRSESADRSFLGNLPLEQSAHRLVDSSCGAASALSAFVQYRRFQDRCGQLTRPCDATECMDQLRQTVAFRRRDASQVREHIVKMQTEDIEELRRDEPEAARALKVIGALAPSPRQDVDCAALFNDDIVEDIRTYVDGQKELIDTCHQAWAANPLPSVAAQEVEKQSEQVRKNWEDGIRKKMEAFDQRCRGMEGFVNIDPQVLFTTTARYRLWGCQGKDVRCREETPQPPRPTPGPPPQGESRTTWLRRGPVPRYDRIAWDSQLNAWKDAVATARKLSGPEQQNELGRVHSEIERYARDYLRAWLNYLGSLSLKERAFAPAWLESLSKTNEYAAALGPACDALAAGQNETEAPFTAMKDTLRGAGPVCSILEGNAPLLGEYQKLLGDLSKDLQGFPSTQAWAHYTNAVQSGQPNNSFVRARQWVEDHAGSTLAQGRMKDLFERPLLGARAYLSGNDPARTSWDGLKKVYAAASPGFPITVKQDTQLVEIAKLVDLLGGASGAAPALRTAMGGMSISAGARNWLDRAGEISSVLFQAGKDDPQPFQITIRQESIAFEPESLAKEFLVRRTQLDFGGQTYDWHENDQPSTMKMSLPLLGDDASHAGALVVWLSSKRNPIGSMFGENWKKPEPIKVAPFEGAWAPLKIIAAGLRQDAANGVNGAVRKLHYVVDLTKPDKPEKPRTITITFDLTARGLDELLALMRDGLSPPPAALTGD